jgi:hypothetical protein
VSARVSVARATALRDLLSGQTMAAGPGGGGGFGGGRGGRGGGGRGGIAGNGGSVFEVPVAAHSFRVFAADNNQ